jgi:hypothetical protein
MDRVDRGLNDRGEVAAERRNGRSQLVNVSRVAPGREAGNDVELSEELADDLVGVGFGAEVVDLGHDLGEGFLGVGNGPLRVELPLLVKAALTLDELFPIETGKGMENRFALRTRIGQEA